MTNFVKLHCMTAEKLAEFLCEADRYDEGPWYKWFNEKYCKKCDEKSGDDDVPCSETLKCVIFDSDKDVILAWLESEYVEAESDEVKRKT